MKLREAIEILKAEAYYSLDELLDVEIKTARASDLMSDVLADDGIPDMLLTELSNAQVIRTASVFGIKAVVIVRGRHMSQNMIDCAREEHVVIIATKYSLFASCGKLYKKGIRGLRE